MADAPSSLPVKVETKPVAVSAGSRGLIFTGFDELARFAQAIVVGGFAPRGLEKPQAVLAAIQAGMELGLTPMKALASVMVVNGRPAIFGDTPLALCMASGQFDHSQFEEKEVGKSGADTWGYSCTVARKGCKPHTATFTVADAKRAKLWGKDGPWTFYPDRMLKARARSFSLRDTFPDVLGGIGIQEEVEDYRPVAVTQQAVESPADRATSRLSELKGDPIDVPQDIEVEEPTAATA